jgi:hypothetical protein
MVSIDNCLEARNPVLARQWHPEKNGTLTSKQITAAASKSVWWQCEKKHEWRAAVSDRAKGTGCPFCAGQKVGKDNSLASRDPELARQWHPTKNMPLGPDAVTATSNKRVWWRCDNSHEWNALIHQRSGGSGCPYCSGRRAHKGHNLLAANPELARQWHPTKNRDLSPDQVTPHSGKKVWWVCAKRHAWAASISNRSKGSGCPVCIGRGKRSEGAK